MRFLIADALNGACFAAIIVLAAGHAQKVAVGPISGTIVRAQPSAEQSQSLVQPSTQDISQPAERKRNIAGTGADDRPSAAIETASIAARDNPPKSEIVSVSPQPSFTRPEPKASGGLGAAADGGIDAYVAPIVRQRAVTPPLKAGAAGKPKEKVKVKSAASAKTKNGAKQATATPASVRR
jgi:hypothetical protein